MMTSYRAVFLSKKRTSLRQSDLVLFCILVLSFFHLFFSVLFAILVSWLWSTLIGTEETRFLLQEGSELQFRFLRALYDLVASTSSEDTFCAIV